MKDYTYEELVENRLIWWGYLATDPPKLTEHLADRDGNRCCLGHGCHALESRIGLKREVEIVAEDEDMDRLRLPYVMYDEEMEIAPLAFVRAVGLRDSNGTIAENDQVYIDVDDPDTPIISKEMVDEYGDSVRLYATLTELNDDSQWSASRIADYIRPFIEEGGGPFITREDWAKIRAPEQR